MIHHQNCKCIVCHPEQQQEIPKVQIKYKFSGVFTKRVLCTPIGISYEEDEDGDWEWLMYFLVFNKDAQKWEEDKTTLSVWEGWDDAE